MSAHTTYELYEKYSSCIAKMKNYQKTPEEFKLMIEHSFAWENELNKAKKINRCKSLTKDYWRIFSDYYKYPEEHLTTEVLKEYKKRHERFVATVEKFDILSGYDEDDKWVYDPRNIFKTKQ